MEVRGIHKDKNGVALETCEPCEGGMALETGEGSTAGGAYFGIDTCANLIGVLAVARDILEDAMKALPHAK